MSSFKSRFRSSCSAISWSKTTGQRIVITAGVPLGTTGATNMLRVAFVTEED